MAAKTSRLRVTSGCLAATFHPCCDSSPRPPGISFAPWVWVLSSASWLPYPRSCAARRLYDTQARTIAYDKRHVPFDERSSRFYEAIGVSVGMQGRVLGFGQVYLEASKDSQGQ
jgi:hypothetical protein